MNKTENIFSITIRFTCNPLTSDELSLLENLTFLWTWILGGYLGAS